MTFCKWLVAADVFNDSKKVKKKKKREEERLKLIKPNDLVS